MSTIPHHKFKIGQNLNFHPGLQGFVIPPGLFTVSSLLPSDGNELQYRVRNVGSGQERIVRESQLRLP
ncbi:hypothetical protein [Niveispirillum sp. KHB5.9]|uniref:hypothetical protein n=1 Tax=Niveispirillum sp. KHB5.9 TaxID=3400269 RepID=UPI003A8A28BF